MDIKRSEIPAVTHVNGSARVQTINPDRHPYIYKILDSFDRKTSCPVLVNTSFNVRDEPIVCDVKDAYKCFMGTNLDLLVCENFIMYKDQQISEEFKNYKNQFSLD